MKQQSTNTEALQQKKVTIENFENCFTVFDEKGEVIHSAETYEECKAWAENYYGGIVAPEALKEDSPFTSGEWEACIDHSREAGAYPKTYIECNGKAIAKCYDRRWTISAEEAEANARLCAAAPLLLKALREAMDIIDRLDELYRDATDRHSTFTKGEFNRLNAAIQKATQG